jgi:SPX domain protein involved in polyphosphate accumulation
VNLSNNLFLLFLSRVDPTTREVSLTAPPPTNQAGRMLTKDDPTVNEEDFYSKIDAQLAKVEAFTLQRVTELRSDISLIEKEVAGVTTLSESEVNRIRELADEVARAFLTLEKYVNVNFMGFHKILKKHDKNAPAHACKQFYINRMHNQAWVRGDYSDVVVRLSAIYSTLRNDHAAEEGNNDTNQSFLRSTTKYWIRTEDVSKVKYAVLKHLPVFLQKTSTGESDSQLTNSVYFDNDQLGEFSSINVLAKLYIDLFVSHSDSFGLHSSSCRALSWSPRQDSWGYCVPSSLVRCRRSQDCLLRAQDTPGYVDR